MERAVRTTDRPRDGLPRSDLLEMYRLMVGERLLAEMGRDPGLTERVFLVGIAEGQEAIAVGSCMALRRAATRAAGAFPDIVVGNYGRDVMGLSYRDILLETIGKAAGRCGGKGGPIHLAAPELGLMSGGGIVGTPLPLAAGFAFAVRHRGTDQVVITYFGDGASNQGLFHEGINLAAVRKLPVIFFCVNNLYAFTTPMARSTSVRQVADRAAAYSIPGVTVDGNDVLAVYDAVSQAAQRARAGDGPSLIEAMTFRWIGPTETGEEKPRPAHEVAAARERDPVARFRAHLLESGLASAADVEAVDDGVRGELDAAFREALAAPWPPLASLQDGVWATPLETGR